ncbi:MAG: MFS transporter [Gammaproteobacteria bacterium]|nr:MFS transporter [Gammaproteobacteria bacterium]
MTSVRSTPRYRNYVLFILFLTYILNYVDRQLMTILLEPIKEEFGASDTAMGFLTGFAFALFYATLGIPVARLADRWSRRNVIAISITLWSGMTALCAAASTFTQLALLRIGVGVGEAGGTPPSHSLIASYFPPEQRSTALSLHATGTHFGVLIGMLGGAVIAEAYGWRMAFVVFGLPGIAVGLLLALTMKEPPRVGALPAGNFRQDISTLLRLPAFVLIAMAGALTGLSGYGLGAWSPSLLIRIHELSLVEAGLLLGGVGTVGGIIGAVAGGVLCDKLVQRDHRWQLWLPALGALASAPMMLAFVMWPESQFWQIAGIKVPVAIIFMLLGGILASLWIGPTYAAIQFAAPDHLRTQASALFLFAFNLVGLGLGPLVVGFASDMLQDSYGIYGLRYALALSMLGVVAGSVLFWLAAQRYRPQRAD